MENETKLSAANLGLVASYYALRHTTIEMFSRSISGITKRKGIIDILSEASEFESIPVRPGEEQLLASIGRNCGVDVPAVEGSHVVHIKPTLKTKILLYAHFHRSPLSIDMQSDQKFILDNVLRIVQGLVDVICSNSTLKQALMAMEVSQMIVQASPYDQSPLMQLPHFTSKLCKALSDKGVTDIFEFAEMEDDLRDEVLGEEINSEQLKDCAKACNRYPAVELAFDVLAFYDIF